MLDIEHFLHSLHLLARISSGQRVATDAVMMMPGLPSSPRNDVDVRKHYVALHEQAAEPSPRCGEAEESNSSKLIRLSARSRAPRELPMTKRRLRYDDID